MKRQLQRGQAIVELAVTLPLLLTSLILLFWSVKYAVVQVRVESDTRYSQQVLNSSNTFQDLSIISLYNATSPKAATVGFMPLPTCKAPETGLIANEASAKDAAGLLMPGGGLWVAPVTAATCMPHLLPIGGGNYSRNYLFYYHTSSITADVVPSFNKCSTKGNQSMDCSSPFIPAAHLISKSVGMSHQASIPVLTWCYPAAYRAVRSSLLDDSEQQYTTIDGFDVDIQVVGAAAAPKLSVGCMTSNVIPVGPITVVPVVSVTPPGYTYTSPPSSAWYPSHPWSSITPAPGSGCAGSCSSGGGSSSGGPPVQPPPDPPLGSGSTSG